MILPNRRWWVETCVNSNQAQIVITFSAISLGAPTVNGPLLLAAVLLHGWSIPTSSHAADILSRYAVTVACTCDARSVTAIRRTARGKRRNGKRHQQPRCYDQHERDCKHARGEYFLHLAPPFKGVGPDVHGLSRATRSMMQAAENNVRLLSDM